MILSSLVNFILNQDPEKSGLLDKYNGKIIQLDILLIPLNIYLIINHNQLELSRETNNIPDVRIQITSPTNISVTGDLVFLQDFKNIISEIDPRWEENLADIIGDPMAHIIIQFLKQVKNTQKNISHKLLNNLTEYLQEEIQYLPTRAETEDFYKNIDKLYHDTERLEARIKLQQDKMDL